MGPWGILFTLTVQLIKPVAMPVLPAHLEGISAQLSTRVLCRVNRDGTPRDLTYMGGDPRPADAIKAAVMQWRWRVDRLDKAATGFWVDMEFKWPGGKPQITRYLEGGPLTGERVPRRLVPERDGIKTWSAGAPKTGWTGWVRISLELNPDGTIHEATFVEGDPTFRALALAAAREWKFQPRPDMPRQLTLSLASADGRPMAGYGVLGVRVHPK